MTAGPAAEPLTLPLLSYTEGSTFLLHTSKPTAHILGWRPLVSQHLQGMELGQGAERSLRKVACKGSPLLRGQHSFPQVKFKGRSPGIQLTLCLPQILNPKYKSRLSRCIFTYGE